MFDKKIDEEIFDTILKKGFEDAFRRELEEYEQEAKTYGTVQPTEQQLSEARQAYKKATRRPERCRVILGRIAVCAMLLFCIGSGCILATPKVSAVVRDTIAEFLAEYLNIDFSKSCDSYVQVGDFRLKYLPEGYVLTEEKNMGAVKTYIFDSDTGSMSLKISNSSIFNVKVDREHYTEQVITINDHDAFAFFPDTLEMKKILVWGNETISFVLRSAELDIEELIKTAESLN